MLSLGGHTPSGSLPLSQPTTQRRSSNTEERRLQAVPGGFKARSLFSRTHFETSILRSKNF